MSLQLHSPPESPVTERARVELQPSVMAKVVGEVVFRGERFATFFTAETFFRGVDSFLVFLQASFRKKSFVTNIAFGGLIEHVIFSYMLE